MGEPVTREEFQRAMDRLVILELKVLQLLATTERSKGDLLGVAEDVVNLHTHLGQVPHKTIEVFHEA